MSAHVYTCLYNEWAGHCACNIAILCDSSRRSCHSMHVAYRRRRESCSSARLGPRQGAESPSRPVKKPKPTEIPGSGHFQTLSDTDLRSILCVCPGLRCQELVHAQMVNLYLHAQLHPKRLCKLFTTLRSKSRGRRGVLAGGRLEEAQVPSQGFLEHHLSGMRQRPAPATRARKHVALTS